MVIELLRKLSREENVACVVIIHQPSPKVFKLFDNLVLLAKGYPVFSGPFKDLTEFYERNYDEALPQDYDLADDLILKATAHQAEDEGHWKGSNHLINTSYDGSGSETLQSLMGDVSDEERNKVLSTHAQPPALWKLTTVFIRNLKNQYISNIANVAGRLASYGFLSLLIGAIFSQVGKGSEERWLGLTFEEAELVVRTDTFILNVSYLLPFAAIPVFVGDKKFFLAESALGLYSPWMYGVSQIVLETLFVTLAATMQTCITVPMCSMVNPSYPTHISFLTMLASLIVSGLVGELKVKTFLAFSDFVCLILSSSKPLYVKRLHSGFYVFNGFTFSGFGLYCRLNFCNHIIGN